MSLNIEKIADNVLSVTPLSYDDGNWLEKFQPIANEIFNPNTTMVLVTQSELEDILSDTAKDFYQLLKDKKKTEYLSEKHHFKRHELKIKKLKYILTSLYNVPKAVIDDIIVSENFTWGSLYLICYQGVLDHLNNELLADIKQMLENKRGFLELPKIKCELLATADDGCEVLWFNPVLNF